jgi:hypothetical protein
MTKAFFLLHSHDEFSFLNFFFSSCYHFRVDLNSFCEISFHDILLFYFLNNESSGTFIKTAEIKVENLRVKG